MLLGAAVYLWLIVWASQFNDDGTNDGPSDVVILVIVVAWNLLTVIATLIAIVDGVLRVRARKTRQLALDAMVVKLASIPFFLLNFLVLAALFTFGIIFFVFGVGVVVWIVVAIGAGLTYLTMLPTSVYLWASITRLRREGIISTRLTVLYTILSFIFVTDVAAGVLVFGQSRRRPRLALVWLLIGAGVALIALGVLEYFLGFVAAISPFPGPHAGDWLYWFIPIILGIVVILVAGVVAVVPRSSLQVEAQRAVAAVEVTTKSDTPDRVLAD
jgi:hypothetical protein